MTSVDNIFNTPIVILKLVQLEFIGYSVFSAKKAGQSVHLK